MISVVDRAFGVVSEKSPPYPRSSLVVFRSFMVLHCTFRSVIHCELILVKGVRSLSRFFFFTWIRVLPAPFIEKSIFSMALSLLLCRRSTTVRMGPTPGLSIPLMCVSVLPTAHTVVITLAL